MAANDQEDTVLSRTVDTVLLPVRAATSKPAQKAYLGSAILAGASLILFCISSVAFVLFYYNYLPQLGLEKTIHLQFGNGHPYGVISLSSALTSAQPYDITLFLHLPRTPANLAAGNFMVDLALLSPETQLSTQDDFRQPDKTSTQAYPLALARSRRTAILTYTSPMVERAKTLKGLTWYLLGWKKESEVLEVKMFERLEFPRGWKNIPDKLQVVLEAEEKMQFYNVAVKIRARFRGIRWLLYNHRIISYLLFTTSFFLTSLATATTVYVVISLHEPSTPSTSDGVSPTKTIKSEDGTDSELIDNPLSTSDLSDTARTFPTRTGQPPLAYQSAVKPEPDQSSSLRIKKEEHYEQQSPSAIAPLMTAAEADDEDEDEDDDYFGGGGFRDSGIGTSYDDEGRARKGGLARRRSGKKSDR